MVIISYLCDSQQLAKPFRVLISLNSKMGQNTYSSSFAPPFFFKIRIN